MHRETAWLRAARRALRETCGDQEGPVRVRVSYQCSGQGVTFNLGPNKKVRAAAPEPAPATAPPSAGSSELHLRRVHRQLLAAATLTPTPAKVLATRAGYQRHNSHIREALGDLVRAGSLRHTPDGYCLPG